MRPVIPNKTTADSSAPFDRKRYRGRNAIERMFCRLKDFRRIAALVLCWLRSVSTLALRSLPLERTSAAAKLTTSSDAF